MCLCHNTPWQVDRIFVLLLGQSSKHTSGNQSPVSSQVSGNQSKTATGMCETSLDKMSQNQAAAGPLQTIQTPVDETVTNTTLNQLSTNQTTTRPSQINQPSETTTICQLPTNQDNLLQASQSATKGIIKYSSAS